MITTANPTKIQGKSFRSRGVIRTSPNTTVAFVKSSGKNGNGYSPRVIMIMRNWTPSGLTNRLMGKRLLPKCRTTLRLTRSCCLRGSKRVLLLEGLTTIGDVQETSSSADPAASSSAVRVRRGCRTSDRPSHSSRKRRGLLRPCLRWVGAQFPNTACRGRRPRATGNGNRCAAGASRLVAGPETAAPPRRAPPSAVGAGSLT
jgi:hypothetical protein